MHNGKKESEKDVELHIQKRAKERGGEAYKFKSPQRKNVPDRMIDIPLPWPIWFIEAKSEGVKPTKGQLREHERLRSRGRPVFVCDTRASVDAAFATMDAVYQK